MLWPTSWASDRLPAAQDQLTTLNADVANATVLLVGPMIHAMPHTSVLACNSVTKSARAVSRTLCTSSMNPSAGLVRRVRSTLESPLSVYATASVPTSRI